ncbi:MAG: ParA family protein, partial [Parasphingopyxis sp.]
MVRIAVYSLKGGVGKTTLAVNLAWCSATLSSRKTLLWDLDAQAAASFLVAGDRKPKRRAEAVYEREIKPSKLIRSTDIERLDYLTADASLSRLDRLFFDLGKKKRLARIIDDVREDYDRVIIDCPPGAGDTAAQALYAADIALVPVTPSPLATRAFDQVARLIETHHDGKTSILPVYTMIDRRRKLHLEALAAHPDWPVIPYASVAEQMADVRRP